MNIVDSFFRLNLVRSGGIYKHKAGARNPPEYAAPYLTRVEIYDLEGTLHYREEVIAAAEYPLEIPVPANLPSIVRIGTTVDDVLQKLQAKGVKDKLGGTEEAGRSNSGFEGIFYDDAIDLRIPEEPNILVLGSGYGNLVRELLEYLQIEEIPGARIAALDINHSYLEHSRAACAEVVAGGAGIDHIAADISKLPFAGQFDVIMADMIYSSSLWPQPAVQESARVLRPGGMLVVQEAYLTPQYVKAILERAGFDITARIPRGEYFGMPMAAFMAQKPS